MRRLTISCEFDRTYSQGNTCAEKSPHGSRAEDEGRGFLEILVMGFAAHALAARNYSRIQCREF